MLIVRGTFLQCALGCCSSVSKVIFAWPSYVWLFQCLCISKCTVSIMDTNLLQLELLLHQYREKDKEREDREKDSKVSQTALRAS